MIILHSYIKTLFTASIFLAISLAASAQVQQNSIAGLDTSKTSESINLDSISNVIDSLNSLLLLQTTIINLDSSFFRTKQRDKLVDSAILVRTYSTEEIMSMFLDGESKKKWEKDVKINKFLYYGENNVISVPSFSSPSIPPEVIASGRCVCAIIHKDFFTKTANGYTIKASKLGDKYVKIDTLNLKLCPEEKFLDEIFAATGTGWAYKDNLIVTANHCFKKIDVNDYKNYFFIFDFLETKAGSVIPNERVFIPVDKLSLQPQDEKMDFAIIKVDHPVPAFRFAQLENVSSTPINTKTARLYMLGHPLGLPLKYTPSGQISYFNNEYFITNLDAYAGNSGSPVFDCVSKKLTGMLISGNSDFEQGAPGCAVSVHHPEDYPENHYGEKVERIINALKKY